MFRLHTISETNALIDAGKRLHLAADEAVLRELHRGTWIGGTIPYFLTDEGGLSDRHRVFATELPESATVTGISLLARDELALLPGDAPENGFSLVILPGFSEILTKYAIEGEHLPRIYEKPVIGWVSGVHLDDVATVKPMVVNGQTGEFSSDRMAVMHAALPDSRIAHIGQLNLFQQGAGDTIVFDETGFLGDACTVNGARESFYAYAKKTRFDIQLPLVSNQSGEMINVCIQGYDDASHAVKFYGPVLKGVEYRQAAPIGDYQEAFAKRADALRISPAFACNCILNYLYGHLEGKRGMPIGGPATFGEIAYVLLNQTMVYLTVDEV
jgi:hypothetical protein